MTIPGAKRTARIIEWRQLIYERQQSGQSVRAWCLQNGIRENRYYYWYWLKIIREEALYVRGFEKRQQPEVHGSVFVL